MGAPDHSSRKHAMLSASKADRWINCTPSARLEEKVEETGKPSKYAEGVLWLTRWQNVTSERGSS